MPSFMLNDKILCHFYAITRNLMSKYHREMKQTNKKINSIISHQLI